MSRAARYIHCKHAGDPGGINLMLKADHKTRKALFMRFVDSLDYPDLEDYAFERSVTEDPATRLPRIDWETIVDAN
jgi:hypothetical protein